MIAAIYARKSTDDSDRNEEARSSTRQVERATEYATAKGWTVDPRYIFVADDVSGAEWKHRPGFNALLAALDRSPPSASSWRRSCRASGARRRGRCTP
jgi:DNA invertase Pin-like site-specific DNA recombinase